MTFHFSSNIILNFKLILNINIYLNLKIYLLIYFFQLIIKLIFNSYFIYNYNYRNHKGYNLFYNLIHNYNNKYFLLQ